jgi:hypothetical protein
MTADPAARERVTIVGALLAAAGALLLVVVGVVAVSTLRNSSEGVAPDVDERTVLAFPDTPNMAVGVVDDLDRLTSLALMTLDPSGAGGSIVTIPVNVDRSNGVGAERQPISRQPFTPGDESHAEVLVSELEPLLSLTIQRAVVLGPDGLAAVVDPLTPLDVDVPQRVEDTDTPGSGFVVGFGERRVDTEQLVAALTAISGNETSFEQHDVDVAMWTGIAAATRPSDTDVARDEFDRPRAPDSPGEFFDRLFAGSVGVRDLAIDPQTAVDIDNQNDADFVLVDRDDALLVFGSISPGLVSTPGDALSLKIVVAFSEEDVQALGEDLDGTQITKASLTRRLIGDVLFAGADVRSVVLTDAPESVPDVTALVLVDESLEVGARSVSTFFFTDADVREANTIIDGIDVEVILGADFLELRADQLAFERAMAEESVDDPDQPPAADFDVEEVDPAANDLADTADGSDTVEANG